MADRMVQELGRVGDIQDILGGIQAGDSSRVRTQAVEVGGQPAASLGAAAAGHRTEVGRRAELVEEEAPG